MGSFFLNEAHGFGEPVKVTLPPQNNIEEDQLLSFAAFKDWLSTLKKNLELQTTTKDHPFREDPYSLLSIEVQSVDFFGPKKIGFLKLKARIENKAGSVLPGIAFLRGGSVAVLMILRAKDFADERYVVLTEQPRVPAGSLQFLEIPAGMLDGETGFSGKAADEIEEETGIRIPKDDLINMTELALQESEVRDTSLKAAMYPSPGGSDEFIPVFLWEKEFDIQEIENLRGKLAGERKQGEMITLRVVEYEKLWREGARDAKTLAAWALYEGLSKAGILQKEQEDRKRPSSNSPGENGDSVKKQKTY